MSAASEIFDRYLHGGWAYIAQVVRDKHPETLHLDFKLKRDPTSATLDRDDRKTFAEALSGFANAEGGVVVWGVDARRVEDSDHACGVSPIQNLRAFTADLVQLTPEMVSPAVRGVQHISVPDSPGSSSGVVITLIPESDLTPHMARGANMHRYYRRTSSSFRVLEHYEVADLFGRRAHPVLRVRTETALAMTRTDGEKAFARLNIHFILENAGRGLARYPALTIAKPSGYDASNWSGQYGGSLPLPSAPAPKGWWLRFTGGADAVVYPDDEFEVAQVGIEFSTRQRKYPDLSISYYAVAAEASSDRGTLVIPGADLRTRAWEIFGAHGFDSRER